MKVYVADFLQETAHLSAAEAGAYLYLLLYYWTHGSLPESEVTIRRISRLTERQWQISKDNLRSMFGPEWSHPVLDQRIAEMIEKSEINSANAAKSHMLRRMHARSSLPKQQTSNKTSYQEKIVSLVETREYEPSEAEWRAACSRFVRNNSHWPRGLGPEPGMLGCRCPAEILTEHGIDPETGIVRRTAK
jgi:uncharacterized protein YdaU (DUF1376 family)